MDNWVLGILAGHPTPPMLVDVNRECKVVEFIDLVSREWSLDPLSNFVLEFERGAISQIHVGPLMKPDKLVWPFEMNGSYSVKYGDRWCHNRLPLMNHDRSSSSHNIDSQVWAWIWNCNAPQKMRNFLWRAFRNGCATKFNLFRRRCALSPPLSYLC